MTYQKSKRNKKHFTFYFVILIFTFCILIFAPLTMAQQVTLSISPSLLELFIKPGKSVLIAYNLENLSDPVILSTKVLPFIPLGNQGGIKIKEEFEGPVRFYLDNANLKLGDSFFLKTKDSQQLLLRVRVPEGSPDGDYYYTFLAETKHSKGTEGNTSSLAKATIGSNILITISESGQVDIKGKVASFDVAPRHKLKLFGQTFNLFESTDKIPVVLILENQGKNLIKPQGEIGLLGNFGERAKFEVLPQNILAQSQRLIQATPSAEIDSPVSLVLSGFFLGKYRLSASINFGEGTPNIFAWTTFYALPIKFLLAFVISIVVVVFIIKRVRD